ncbi:hypothetical protein ABZ624_41300, partial [Streptomyces sp. NPDC007205]
MCDITRRRLLGLGAGAAAWCELGGCSTSKTSGRTEPAGHPGYGHPGYGRSGEDDESRQYRRPIGDGSTSFTGKQPHQPAKPEPLQPGQTPPQFVIFSWDGAGEVGNGLFPRFLDLAKEHGASMTFFLSGLYLLP